MLYLKLILRGITRHKKRGLKFFVLLSVCFMMAILSLSFQDSFYEEYVQLGIDARNAHINIYSPESVWLKDSFTSIQKEGLPLLEIDDEFNQYVNTLTEVELGTPIIETGGIFYTLEGKVQSGGTITGVRAADFKRIFPGIVTIEGSNDLTVEKGTNSIPFVRWLPQRNEVIQNIAQFTEEDFKLTELELEEFKRLISKDFPQLLDNQGYEGATGTGAFIQDLNKILSNPQLHEQIPAQYREGHQFHLMYLIDQIKTLSFQDEGELKNWNKRLLQAVYPDVIAEVPEGIALNKPMGLFVESTDDTRPPTLIPIEFVGYVEGIPEFYGYNFVELEVLQNYIDVEPDQCTAYLIRLHDEGDIGVVMAKLESYIEERGLDYKVVDYQYIGNKTHMPIAIGVSLVFRVLVFLFLIISVFFVSYIVTISLIRRRKEMGTVMTLGMGRLENILVIIGENFVVMTIAWLAASIPMALLLLYLSQNGLGGIVFFPRGKLHFIFKYDYFIQAYLLIMIPGLLASMIPAIKLRNVTIVELLKGEISRRKLSHGKQLKINPFKTVDGRLSLMIKLGIRNIFANKRRNTIIFAIFTAVSTILYLFLAFGDGGVSNFRNGFQALDNPRSQIVAAKRGYADRYKTNSNSEDLKEMTITEYEPLREELLKLDYVEDVYVKTIPVTLDLYIREERFKNLSFRGVDKSMFSYLTSKIDIVEGRMITPEDENVLLLNIVNKPELEIEVKEETTVLGSDHFNHVVSEDFQVIGYYRPKIDNPFFTTLVFTDLMGYNGVSGYTSQEANFLNIDLKKGQSLEKRIENLNQWADSKGLDVEFNDFNDIYVRDDQLYGTGRTMISALTYLVIFFVMIGIINMILINLFDRRKEIGTYYCIGAEKSLLIGVYTAEILIINLVATITGVTIGLGLQKLINGLKISSTNPGVQLAFGGSTFYLQFNLSTALTLLLSVLLITLLISLTSLRSSLKVSPIAALQEIDE